MNDWSLELPPLSNPLRGFFIPPPKKPPDGEAFWSGRRDSNPRPPRPERGALPGCATPRQLDHARGFLMAEFMGGQVEIQPGRRDCLRSAPAKRHARPSSGPCKRGLLANARDAFEPTASSSRTRRATRLRHAPTIRSCAGERCGQDAHAPCGHGRASHAPLMK